MLPLRSAPRAAATAVSSASHLSPAARRMVHSARPSVASGRSRSARGGVAVAAASLAAAAVGYGLYAAPDRVHLDAAGVSAPPLSRRSSKNMRKDEEAIAASAPAAQVAQDSLSVYAWGDNTYRVVAPDLDGQHHVRMPRPISAFDGVALRDLWLGETHGAAVDANGDLMQWGLGFFYPATRLDRSQAPPSASTQPLNPIKTLSGKNLRKVVGTEGKLYALADSGEVWVVSGARAPEPIPGHRKWSTLGLSSSAPSQVAHVPMQAKLGFGEWVTDIDTGRDHVLAVTSKGRVLAAPSNTKGNESGQLAFRRVVVSDAYATAPTAGPSADEDPGAIPLGERVVLDPLPPPEGPPLPAGKAYRAFEPKMFEIEDYLERESNLTLANLLPAWAQTPEQMASTTGMIKPSRSTHPAARELVPRTDNERRVQNERKAARARAQTEILKEYMASSVDVSFCSTLEEVPSLRGVPMQAVAAGEAHSVALTTTGRVVAWGANSLGQCGFLSGISSRPATSMGYAGLTQRHAYTMDQASSNVNAQGPIGSSSECVPVPTEVNLSRVVGGDARKVRCTAIRAGGKNTFYLVSSSKPVLSSAGQGKGGEPIYAQVEEVYAAGKGQAGTLGNGTYMLTTASPVRVKGVSGRQEYSDALKKFVPIPIAGLSVGADGHALATIATSGYRDLMIWGSNLSYQLGDGRRSNSALPHYLAPLASLAYLRNPPPNAGEDEDDTSPLGAGDMSILRPVLNVTDPELLKLAQQSALEKYRYRVNEANFLTGTFAGQPEVVLQSSSQRLQLAGKTKVRSRVPSSSNDGSASDKKVAATQDVLAGFKSSAVFWRAQ